MSVARRLGSAPDDLSTRVGAALAGNSLAAYPLGLGLAAGAMVFAVSREVIPETRRNGDQTAATIGLMAGFVVMMVLDSAW